MTICLSAYSHPDRAIVSVSDRMVTMGNTTSDNCAHKWYAIHRDWHVLFSGDAGLASRIMQRAIPQLDPAEMHSAIVVGDAVEHAWATEHSSVVRAAAASAYGLSLDELIRVRPELASELARESLGCEFLVSGFDSDGYPHVLWLDFMGKVRECDSFGYWAVGSGTDLARASLAMREQSIRCDTATTLCNLLEARFNAETDANVGQDETLAMVIRQHAQVVMLDGGKTAAIRSTWKMHQQQFQTAAVTLLRGFIDPPRTG